MNEYQRSTLSNLKIALNNLRTFVSMPEIEMSVVMIDELLRPSLAEIELISDKQATLLNDVLN